MKNYIKISVISLLAMFAMTSCDAWLTEPSPAVVELSDYFASGETGIFATNGAYVPLTWEFNGVYYSEFFIGDIMSDDALKGGQNTSEGLEAYDLDNFKILSNNAIALEYYRAQYQGIGRCNLALQEVPAIEPDSAMTVQVQDRLLGELKFLRAMYYFRLVRLFGGVPLVDFVVDSQDKWQQPRASADAVYTFILADLADANDLLWKKSAYDMANLGRATKGAAQAMLLKVNLYMHNYSEAERWGDSIMSSGEYDLYADYASNYLVENENGLESVFEVQYMEDPTSDYGDGNGFTRGTFTTILTRSRSGLLGGGWGWNKPTQNLYDAYEANDLRRDATILNPRYNFDDPTDPTNQMENPNEEIYLGSPYLNRKTGWYGPDDVGYELDHHTRGPLNRIDIRYADVLLMYAEAACETGNTTGAKAALELVRDRADSTAARTILPEFPNYKGYTDSQDDLREAIRHERRVELAMEGHRWYDIVRWGVAKEVMDAYKASESNEVQNHMADFIKGKHELLPIPSKEIELNPMQQNPNY